MLDFLFSPLLFVLYIDSVVFAYHCPFGTAYRIVSFGRTFLVIVPDNLLDDFRGAYIGQEPAVFEPRFPPVGHMVFPPYLIFAGYED